LLFKIELFTMFINLIIFFNKCIVLIIFGQEFKKRFAD